MAKFGIYGIFFIKSRNNYADTGLDANIFRVSVKQ
jgi:hypothetical protein